MQEVTETAEQLLDIWPYVDAVPTTDLNGFTLGDVAHVYLHPTGSYLHILIATDDKNVFLIIIIEMRDPKIYGYHLLNLIELYSLAKVDK